MLHPKTFSDINAVYSRLDTLFAPKQDDDSDDDDDTNWVTINGAHVLVNGAGHVVGGMGTGTTGKQAGQGWGSPPSANASVSPAKLSAADVDKHAQAAGLGPRSASYLSGAHTKGGVDFKTAQDVTDAANAIQAHAKATGQQYNEAAAHYAKNKGSLPLRDADVAHIAKGAGLGPGSAARLGAGHQSGAVNFATPADVQTAVTDIQNHAHTHGQQYYDVTGQYVTGKGTLTAPAAPPAPVVVPPLPVPTPPAAAPPPTPATPAPTAVPPPVPTTPPAPPQTKRTPKAAATPAAPVAPTTPASPAPPATPLDAARQAYESAKAGGSASTTRAAYQAYEGLLSSEGRTLFVNAQKNGSDVAAARLLTEHNKAHLDLLHAEDPNGHSHSTVRTKWLESHRELQKRMMSAYDTYVAANPLPAGMPRLSSFKRVAVGKDVYTRYAQGDAWGHAAFPGVPGKLSSGEKTAVQIYNNAVDGSINAYLRGTTPDVVLSPEQKAVVGASSDTAAVKKVKQAIHDLTNVIDNHPMSEDVQVFRGVDGAFAQKLIADWQSGTFQPGDVLSEKGFCSTSVNKPFEGPVQFIIKVPKGAKATYVSNVPGLRWPAGTEVLLQKGSQMRVDRGHLHEGTLMVELSLI